MTAPDPGLTDLIAAHQAGERWTDFEYPSIFSDKPFMATTVRKMVNCSCGESMPADDHSAHVALAVEQHTNRRITEPETTSEGGKRWYVNGYASVEFDAACDIWLNEVDPYVGDSGHARKLAAALHAAATAADELRAALEGEQR